MKPLLQFQATQSLALTPHMQRSLKLLQLSGLEYQQQLQTDFACNPFINLDEPEGLVGDADELGTDLMLRGGSIASTDDGDTERDTRAAPVGLRAHLRQQIGTARLGARDALIATLVAEAVDDDGYLRVTLDEIAAAFPGVAPQRAELRIALRLVQSLEPAGVGAHDPAECLALQLDRVDSTLPGHALARRIVREQLGLLATHDTPRLARMMGCSCEEIVTARRLIMSLDPHPGSRFGEVAAPCVTADVLVGRGRNGRWRAEINPATLPRLHINRRYVDIFRSTGRHRAAPMAEQLQEARWLLRNVRQRFRTIREVAQAIVDRQSRFFVHGAIALQPLMQRDIANDLGIHESTVSRVANGKYMATPHGVVEFRRFFGNAVHATDGKLCATSAVQALISELVEREDPSQPLSDLKLMRALEARGVRIARRTVTKYRDLLRIPPWRTRQLSAANAVAIRQQFAGGPEPGV